MKALAPNRVLEKKLVGQGNRLIVGIDEVGRGPMAGPVTVAAVVLPMNLRLPGVRDSKLMTLKARQKAVTQIQKKALGVALGWASHLEIDSLGLTAALRLASQRALSQLPIRPDVIILDGKHNYLGGSYNVELCVKADQSCLPVAAASVVAKVARDKYMELIDRAYPGYGFASHKGYATVHHRRALLDLGMSPCHRRRWMTVRQLESVG